jgi:chaperonin cofactor prefoldin
MKIGKLVGDLVESGDPGAYIKRELEEGLEPVTERIERLESKVDTLIKLLESIDNNLKKLQPLYDFVVKLPFFKK